MSNAQLKEQVFARSSRSKAKKFPKVSVLASYFGVFALIISIVSIGYHQPQETTLANAQGASASSSSTPDSPSVDELVATDIASNLATSTDMPVAKNVVELSLSLAAKSELTQTSDTTITKPQIIQPTSDNRTIQTYKAVAGDTVQSIAAAHGLSPDTIKWANNMTSDAVEPGRELTLLPIDGVLYTTKPGDTVESIASTYNADGNRIVTINDLEIAGLSPNTKVIIPGGVLPETQRPGYVAPRIATTYGGAGSGGNLTTSSMVAPASSGNGYAFGYCTWYAYERRAQLGRPIGGNWGNASSWAAYARGAGFLVNRTPGVGAIIQNGGGAGHVAIVEQVLPDGSIVLSEMNYAGGWNRVTKGRTLSAGQAASYNYIH